MQRVKRRPGAGTAAPRCATASPQLLQVLGPGRAPMRSAAPPPSAADQRHSAGLLAALLLGSAAAAAFTALLIHFLLKLGFRRREARSLARARRSLEATAEEGASEAPIYEQPSGSSIVGYFARLFGGGGPDAVTSSDVRVAPMPPDVAAAYAKGLPPAPPPPAQRRGSPTRRDLLQQNVIAQAAAPNAGVLPR